MKRPAPDIQEQLRTHLALTEEVKLWHDRWQAAKKAGKTREAVKAKREALRWLKMVDALEQLHKKRTSD